MASQPIAGVAVWAHTGRGLFLGDEMARKVLRDWREKLPDKVIIAGVGSMDANLERASARTLEMAENAARIGLTPCWSTRQRGYANTRADKS